MSGCYQYTGMPDTESVKNNLQSNEDFKRRKRETFLNQTNDLISFCSRYAVLEKSKECAVN
jgi:hypothetical protein